MTKNSTASNSNNMKLIGAAIIVIIIIVAGALLITGSKSSATKTTTTVVATTIASASTIPTTVAPSNGTTVATTAATTAPTTTVASGSTTSPFQDWSGKNLTLAQFSQQTNNFTFTKATMLNVSYNYESQIAFNGSYGNISENTTGTTSVQKYFNSSRIETTGSSSYGSFSSITIHNATSGKAYLCTTSPINDSVSCMLTQVASIVNSTGILGSVGSNVTVSGYYNNIKVSSASYNGQPCTLVTGDLYIKAVTNTTPSSTSVIEGTSSACSSTQYNAWLNQTLVGNISSTVNGSVISAKIYYTEGETSIGTSTTAAITALPGPVVSS